MKTSLFASILLAGFTPSLLAGESNVGYRSHALTIDEAVQIAIKQNPNILRQIQELKRNKGLVYEAQARLLPQVTGNVTYSQEDPGLVSRVSAGGLTNLDVLALPAGQPLRINPNGTNNLTAIPINSLVGSGTSVLSGTTTSWQVQIQVTQLLYDGGATFASRRAARINEDGAYYTLRDLIDSTVETVRTQFYQILLNKALVQVQEESVNLLQSQLEDQKSRFEAGTVPQFNVLQAQSSLQNQIPLLIQAQNNYRISMVQLAKTLGIPAGRQYSTDEPLPVAGRLTYTPIKYDLSSALITARANRPFLKAQRSNVLSSVEQITVAAAGWKPTISANIGLRQINNQRSVQLDNTLQGWFFGFTGSWNIFDGGNTYGSVKAARASLEENKVTLDDSTRQVELDVSTAVDNLRNAQETIAASETAVQVSQEALRLSNERLAAGTGTQLDVLTQQTALTTSRSNLVTAQFNYIAAVAQFQFATGTETKYNDTFDSPDKRPATLTNWEANKAIRSRYDSPLDPCKPATTKAKKESLTPPQGKIEFSND
jgi:outer membrane protein TolC